VGLGSEINEWDDIEWFDPADIPAATQTPYVDALLGWLRDHPLWHPDVETKVLLVDLDNLRAEPVRLRARIEATVALARDADYAAFAGQVGSVRRARPHLAEFADGALAVGNAGDEADWALRDAAMAAEGRTLQFVVVSNDGIFADLAERGALTILSPGAKALSDRLRDAAERVVDMAEIEQSVGAEAASS
jgi:hypothetical protein